MANFGPPILKSDLPLYPQQVQLLRVTVANVPGPSAVSQNAGSSVPGATLYVAFVQQLQTDSLLPRDREPCLVDDVNGGGLAPGLYLGRLAGSYNGLPVYEVTERAEGLIDPVGVVTGICMAQEGVTITNGSGTIGSMTRNELGLFIQMFVDSLVMTAERRQIIFADSTIVGDAICTTESTICCDGTGTGGDDGVITECCPDYVIPDTLCLTVTGTTEASRAGIIGTFNLVYTTSGFQEIPGWKSAEFNSGGNLYYWFYHCVNIPCSVGTLPPYGWELDLIFAGIYETDWDCDFVCEPHSSSEVSVNGFGGSASSNVTWTVTEGGCGAPPPSGINRTNLDSGQSTDSATLTIAGLTVTAGALLIVPAWGIGPTFTIAATFGGTPMTYDGGSRPYGVFYLSVPFGTTGSLVITATGTTPLAILASVLQVTGLASNLRDYSTTDDDTVSQPRVLGALPTAVADEYVQSFFTLTTPGGAWIWAGGFTSGAQDESVILSGTTYALTEGYRILSAIDTPEAILTGINTCAVWAGGVTPFK